MIALEGVSAVIGTRTVISDVSLTVERGEVVVLCGPNGAGKSSVIRAACGLLPVSSGRVLLGGEEIGTLNDPTRASRIAYLPQDRRIAWNMPAIEIAALGSPHLPGSEARQRAMAALAEVEADHLANRGVAEMSGGERARVLIARALATEAAVLALDEPVSGLDPDAQFLVMERLRAHAGGGKGVLISLHDLSLAAEWADRVVVIDAGRAVSDASPPQALSVAILDRVFRVSGRWLEDDAGRPGLRIGRRATGAGDRRV